MLLKKYKSIMEQPEESRNRWAFGFATTFTVAIFFGWMFYSGYLSFGDKGTIAKEKNTNQVAAAAVSAQSPLENSKGVFKAAFKEIDDKYHEIKDSIANVLVPFVTGIEVYERK